MLQKLKYELIKGPKDTPVTLGSGSFGTVKLARHLQTGQVVALKLIYNRNALNQISLQRRLDHPNIIRIVDASYDKERNTTLIAMEYVNNGTLFESIHEGAMTRHMVKRVFTQVCKALAYLHEQGIMHRDIKPENILLNKQGIAKLCDFGFAADSDSPRNTLCGTYEYMSPQMILGQPYTQKNDIWSLGILLFEMIEGCAPFRGNTRQEIYASMKKDLFFSKKFTEEEISLLHMILRVNPNNRPEVLQIMKHRYFQEGKPARVSEQVASKQQQRIKLVEVKIVKTEGNCQSQALKLSSMSHLKGLFSKWKSDQSNTPSTASNSVCENTEKKREKLSLKGRRRQG